MKTAVVTGGSSGIGLAAVNALPEALKEEANKAFERLETVAPAFFESAAGRKNIMPFEHVTLGDYEVAFGSEGEIVYLSKGGQKRITDGTFGRLGYTTYNALDCVDNYYSYNREFRMNQCWSEGDFSKPGLEFVENLEHRDYPFGMRKAFVSGNRIFIKLEGNRKASEEYGCPRNAFLVYEFEDDRVNCSLKLTEKDANRMPEALWFDMNFDVENPFRGKTTG